MRKHGPSAAAENRRRGSLARACMVKRFLISGVNEDGVFAASKEGTPQGGVISPLLANMYLHYALDLWYERAFCKVCRGRTRPIRYADDFIVCFEYQSDAERFRRDLVTRLAKVTRFPAKQRAWTRARLCGAFDRGWVRGQQCPRRRRRLVVAMGHRTPAGIRYLVRGIGRCQRVWRTVA